MIYGLRVGVLRKSILNRYLQNVRLWCKGGDVKLTIYQYLFADIYRAYCVDILRHCFCVEVVMGVWSTIVVEPLHTTA